MVTILAMADYPHFGTTLMRLMKARGWSQSQLAAESGKTMAQISLWVTEAQVPNRANRKALADAFSVELADLEAEASGQKRGENPDAKAGPNDRTFPLVNVAPAGTMGWHCELGPTTQDSPDRVSAPWLPADPNIFAVRIGGDSMDPPLLDGWIAFFRWRDRYVDAPIPIENGTMVYVCCTADSDHPEECCIAQWSFDDETRMVTLTKTAKKYKDWRAIMITDHVRQVAVFVGMMPKVV